MIDWSQLFITALDRHRQGQLDEALSLYRVLLCGTPDHVDAWHNLSIIEFDKSGPSQALPGFIRARRGGIQNLIFWRSNVRGLVLGGYHDAAEDLLRECEESALFHTEEIDDFKDEVDSIIESTELDKLENWMGAKRMSEVVERSSRLVARYPQNAFFWKSLGSARQFLGQSTDAIVALSAALNIERHDFQSLLNRGSAVHDLGSFDLAKDDFERAICLSPENPLCEMNLGVALSRLGYRGDGLARYKRASSLGPKVLECLLTFGVALRETNLNRDARDVFMRILGLDPAFPAALAQYGLTHRESGNTTGACTVFERAILLAPHIADAYGFLGATLSDIASDDVQRARAHRSFLLSLALDPVEPEALNNLGVLLHKMQRYAEAKSVLRRAMALVRDYADPRSNLGVVLQSERQLQRAVDSYAQALVLAPGFYQAINNLGSAEWRLGNTERALVCFARTLAISPDYAFAVHNQCKVLHGSLRLDEAIQGYEDLGRRFPDLPDVFWHQSLALLARGDYERGWRLYEYRWVSEKRETLGVRGPLETMWTGGAILADCRLLIYAEQGLGDTLQFCRYAPVLTARGTEVITRVPNALARLLRGQQGFGTVIGFDDPVPNFDLHCPMMSLPLAFGTTLASIPFSRSPYLHALSDDVTHWNNRFREIFGGTEPGRRPLRVGLVWQGGFRPEEPESWEASQRRNIPLEAFAAALDIPGIDFVSLQKGDPAESELRGRESEFWKKGRIFNVAEDLRDFADTAGAIANLDLVISVDTSTAHLSAAMGKPTWILNRYDTCWRWLLDREDSPWYGSVRLYRQGSDRSWRAVLHKLAEDLRAWHSLSANVESKSG